MLENPHYHDEDEGELTILPPLFWVAVIFLAFAPLYGCATATATEEVRVCYVHLIGKTDSGLFVEAQRCMSPEGIRDAEMNGYRLGLMHGALLVALVLVAFVACHAQDWIIVNGFAQHLGSGSHCNNHDTAGAGIERDHAQVGFYRNSNCKLSIYAAKAWLPIKAGAVKLGLIGGAVTGYASAVTPVAALAATYETKTWGLNLIGIPPTGGSSGGVIWGQFKLRW